MKQRQRNEVAQADTWDLRLIFKDDQAWLEAYTKVEELLNDADKYQDTFKLGSAKFKEALKYQEELFQQLGVLYVYANLKQDQDTRNDTYQTMQSKIKALYSNGAARLSFFTNQIMDLGYDKVKEYLNSDDELKQYTHYFEEFFALEKYTLSEKEEKLLAQASNSLGVAQEVFSILNNADLKFENTIDDEGNEVVLSHGSYGKLLESKQQAVRKEAFTKTYQTYDNLKNTFATTLAGYIKKNNFVAEVRGYDSARHQSLSADFINENVYDQLVTTINDNLDLLHQYVSLRKKILKLEEVHMYDMYVAMVDDIDLSFTYDEAKKIILEALSILGEEYLSVVTEAFDKRWIDHVESEGKRSGAYSSGTYGTAPYILMNWQDTLDNVFTLAHEIGHSIHSYYTRANQPFIYGNYSIFLAEVASTTNENLLTEYLLNKYEDPKIKAYIINHYLDGFKGTVFRQTQFAQFEQFIYQSASNGDVLTADYLSKHYFELNEKYYGKEVVYDDAIRVEWSRIPHFYYNYYVFQYATGFSAASALSYKIINGNQQDKDNYIAFLKAGCSDYPIEVLKKAGVDMNSKEVTLDALKVFKNRLNQLEELLG